MTGCDRTVHNFFRYSYVKDMPLVLPTTPDIDHSILSDPDRALQDMSVHVAARRSQLLSKVVGKSVTIGTYRGTVAGVERGQLHIRTSDGSTKAIPLTQSRFTQLTTETTRK